jgi:hypothetical protein
MLENTHAWFFPLCYISVMIGVVLINHVTTHLRTEKRFALEASRLHGALGAELRSLQSLFAGNLNLLGRDANYILSGKSSALVYKGNLGRLTTLLDRPIIEQVVAIYAQNERIEAILGACAKPNAGGLAYRVSPGEVDLQELKVMYEEALKDIAVICEALEHRSHVANGVNDGMRWQIGLVQALRGS